MTFEDLRADYLAHRSNALALPITGAINYSAAAVLSLLLAPQYHNAALTLCFWAIMPVARLIGHFRAENMYGKPDNPLFQLGALIRIMVLLTWAIHIPVWIYAPELFPLTVGIAFSLHWIVYGWIIGNRLGLVHTCLRTALVLLAWHLVPANRMGAVCVGVAIAYLVSIWQLSRMQARYRAAQPTI
jgi:hypothetical protein